MNWGGPIIFGAFAVVAGFLIYNAPPPKPDTTVVIPTDNPSVTVKKIFSHEGCTGYEAYGSALGSTVYYVRCENETVNTNWNKRVGKRVVHMQAETVSK